MQDIASVISFVVVAKCFSSSFDLCVLSSSSICLLLLPSSYEFTAVLTMLATVKGRVGHSEASDGDSNTHYLFPSLLDRSKHTAPSEELFPTLAPSAFSETNDEAEICANWRVQKLPRSDGVTAK